MALEGYYNLKEKKKKNVLDAIASCLRCKSYEELSVNDIVHEADISRGSFYNYFIDKHDAVATLVESRIREHFEQYIEAIKQSDYSLIEGTRKAYEDVKDVLKDEINISILRNLKFFIEFGIQSVHSEKYEKEIDEIVHWLIDNTSEGKTTLYDERKMTNVLDMLIILILNTVFTRIMFHSQYFEQRDDFNYKLDLIKNSIKCNK